VGRIRPAGRSLSTFAVYTRSKVVQSVRNAQDVLYLLYS